MYRKTADEIMELDPEIAIIPVGSVEQMNRAFAYMEQKEKFGYSYF